MSFDLQRILASKRALRRHLAARPIAEKLRLLDAMRERALAIHGALRTGTPSAVIRETPPGEGQPKSGPETGL